MEKFRPPGNLPKCCICKMNFIAPGVAQYKKERVPLILKCGHSSCENCILMFCNINRPILCDVCKIESPLPASTKEEDINAEFPVSKYLLGMWTKKSKEVFKSGDSKVRFVKKVKPAAKSSERSSCQECGSAADCFCDSCAVAYCNPCFQRIHKAAKVFSKHKAVALAGAPGSLPEMEEPMCHVHPEIKATFFCKQCNVSICPSCLVCEHNGHTMQSIDDKNKELIEEIVAAYARVSNLQEVMKASKKKAKEVRPFSRKNSEPSVDCMEQRIADHFMKLHAHLELVENRLQKSLSESSSVVSFKSVIDQLTDQSDKIQTVLLKTKQTLKNGLGCDYFSLLEELKSLENLPAVFVCSKNEPVDECLFIDPGIFDSLDNHVFLLNNDSQSYSLAAETEVPENEVPRVRKMTEDEARNLLFSNSRESISTLCLDPDNDRSESMSSNSSRSRASSISSSSADTLKFLSPPDDLVPGMIIRVNVSHIGSPSNFYIQRDGAGKRLEKLQKGLKRDHHFYFKHRNNVEYREEQLYMMLYEDLNWCRCQILELVGISHARVLHIDYGITETVIRAKLLPMPNHYARVPPLAVQCRLANCFPRDGDQWCAKVTPLMLRMLEGPGATWVTIYSKNEHDGWNVQLNKDIETSYIDIGEALVFQGLAVYGKSKLTLNLPENLKGRKNQMFPPQPMLAEQDLDGMNVELAKVFDPSYFYITIPNGDFKTFHKQFQKECAGKFAKFSKIVHYPAIGMAVFAQSQNGNWERGLVYGLQPNQLVEVFFVDTGDIEVLNLSMLRVLPIQNFRLHPQAYRCSMSDIAPPDGTNWPPEAAQVILNFKMKPLSVAQPQLKSVGLSILLIRTGAKADICVNALLVREKLAKSIGPYGSIVEFPKVPSLITSEEPIIVDQSEELKVISPAPMPSLKISKRSASRSAADSILEISAEFNEPNDCVVRVNESIRMKVNIIRYDDPGKFFVTLSEHDERYEQLFGCIQQYYSPCTDWRKELTAGKKWKKDEKCAVKVNGQWRRGFIESIIDEDRVTIKLVDEAEEICAPTNINIVAPLQEAFQNVIDRAFECALGGIQPAASSTWTGTANFMVEEFITAHRNTLYITKMKGPEDGKMRVQLFHRGRIEATAVEPAYDSWKSLNHSLRMRGVAKPDAFTQWDSQGNIINHEVDNALEDEAFLFHTMMREMFHTRGSGQLRPRVDSDPCKTSWMPAEPISNLTIVGKPTCVGSNCEIYFHDVLNVTVLLKVINDEANRLCEGTLPPDPPINWEVGDICVAQFYADDRWYRSEIVKVNVSYAESIPVHLVKFVDYGNEEFITADKIRPASGITMRPVQVQVGHFDNLAPIGETWSPQIVDEIHKLIVDKDCRVELRKLSTGFLAIRCMFLPDGKNALEEIISRRLGIYRTYGNAKRTPDLPDVVSTQLCEDLVSDQLLSSEEPKLYGLNWLNRYDKDDRYELPENFYRFMEVPDGLEEMTVEVLAITVPDLIIIEIKDTVNKELLQTFQAFEKLQGDMQIESESQPPLEPPYTHKICASQFNLDNMWYRAVVIQDMTDNGGDNLMVQYVDYGNTEVVPVDRTRQMKSDWLSVPLKSLYVRLAGYEFSTRVPIDEIVQALTECFFATGPITAKIIKREKNLRVELSDTDGNLLYQDLIDRKFLVPID